MPGSFVLSRPAALRLRLRCDFGEVNATADAVCGFLREQGCGTAVLNELELALVEGCNNAVKYAAPSARDLPVMVECLCDGGAVELRIHDHTPGFDWPTQPALPPSESEGGRGVYLMRTLMDEAAYFRGAQGNLLVLRKQGALASPAAAPIRESEQAVAELVEELSSCYESLSAIFRYSAAKVSGADLREFAQRLLGDLLQITGADWFVLRLAARSGSQLEVFACAGTETSPQALPLAEPKGNARSLEQEAISARRNVWFHAGQPVLPGEPLAAVAAESSGLVHPIFSGENLVGTLSLGRRGSAANHGTGRPPFTAGQTNVVGTFAEFLAIQVANARLQDEQLAGRLLARELEIAANIQQALLPRELPALVGFELAADCRSARQVGGDFYDVVRLGDQELLLVIADVMGKGIPAAMFAAILRSLVRAVPELARQPAALLARLNRLLLAELSGVDMFITVQLVCCHGATADLAVASAGHCPLQIVRAGEVRAIAPEGLPLGVQADGGFTELRVPLPPGAAALLYTDGLLAMTNSVEDSLGYDQFVRWLSGQAAGSAAELKQHLIGKLEHVEAGRPLPDDQTFLILHHKLA